MIFLYVSSKLVAHCFQKKGGWMAGRLLSRRCHRAAEINASKTRVAFAHFAIRANIVLKKITNVGNNNNNNSYTTQRLVNKWQAETIKNLMILQHGTRTIAITTTAIRRRRIYYNKAIRALATQPQEQYRAVEKSVNDPKAIFIREQQQQKLQ